MHLSEEQVQRLIHGELAPAPAREHLSSCPECRDRVDQAQGEEQWVLGRLEALDHALPPIQAADIVRSARSRSLPAWGRWAAGIFLGAAVAGAAYAAPGSPLPKLLNRLIESIDTRAGPARPANPPDRAEAQAGIAVAPGNRLIVSFRAAAVGDTAVVSLSDGGEVVIQARGARTSFTSEPERVMVGHEGGPGRFRIQIPRSAPLVEIEASGRRLLLKQGSRVTAEVSPDSGGHYFLPLVSSR